MSHVVTFDEFWIDKNSRLSVAIVDNRDNWCFQVSVLSRDAAGLMQPIPGVVFRLKHLDRFNNATLKAFRGAVARDIIPVREPEQVS